MTPIPTHVFLLITAFCARFALSSTLYNNDFFTRISKEEVNEVWNKDVDPSSFITDSFSCEVVQNSSESKVKVFDDFLTTEGIKRPPTVVIVPRNKKWDKLLVDVKYVDFTGSLDVPEGYPEAECYIIPPYKPLLYISVQSENNAIVDIYTLREEEKGSKNAQRDDRCKSLTPELLKKCAVVGPPVSYDYPIHPFFLTASRKVERSDISLFTITSIERISRLLDLLENWDGPVSAAIEISNMQEQLPIFMNTWLTTPKMRRNVDIHLLFDDYFPYVTFPARLFPINYLRDFALKNTRTDIVLFVECDYVFNKHFKHDLINRKQTFLDNPYNLYVVPCVNSEPAINMSEVPETKEALEAELNKPKSENRIFAKPHRAYFPLRIRDWLRKTEIYDIRISDNEEFEPYYVTNRFSMFYDEVFNGWGFDKISHAYTVRGLKMPMKMLPDVIIIHLTHHPLKNYSEWDTGYKVCKRSKMKELSWKVVAENLKGFMVNDYYPSWLKTTPIMECAIKSACLNNRLLEDVQELKERIEFLRKAIAFVLVGFAACLGSFILVDSRRRKKESSKDIN